MCMTYNTFNIVVLLFCKHLDEFFVGVVSTPSPATGYGQSPSSNHPYNTPSSGYSPNMPYNPQTPGAGLDVLPMTEWHTVDIEVKRILYTSPDNYMFGLY